MPWDAGRPLPDEDATYALIPTSGTTGRPKAVRVTGRMTGHAAVFYARTLGLHPGDRTAIHLPFAWVSGHVTQLTPAMLSGGSAVTMATFSRSSLVEVVHRARRHLARRRAGRLRDAAAHPGLHAAALPDVRLAVFGGAPAPPGTLDRVRRAVPAMRLFDVYALSETCAPVTCLPDAEAVRRRRQRRAPRALRRPAAGRTRTAPPSRAASPARCGCAPPPSRPATGATTPWPSPPTAGCAPATSGGWTPRASSPSAGGPSTSSSAAA